MRIARVIVALCALLLTATIAHAQRISAVVEIAGTQLSFQSVSGLGSGSEVIEVADPNDRTNTRKLIGATKWPNIVLKRGFSGDETFPLHQLERAFAAGTVQPADATLTAYDRRGRLVGKWTLKEAWISKWEGPEFDATKNEVSIETIEIAHHGIKE